jgi:hypothetical protein
MSNSITTDTLLLDIAFMQKDFSPVELTCTDNHIIELDEIPINITTFKQLFYPRGENFGIDSSLLSATASSDPSILRFITFSPPFRTINNGEPFSLLEQILLNIETDLNVTRNCFATNTLIELSKELSSIKTLNDIKFSDSQCSLTWTNVTNIIKHEYINRSSTNPLNRVILVISVIFKTQNTLILPTIIKFKYRINEYIPQWINLS